MKSTASVFNHPMHPMLVAIPIGLWSFSFVCDLVWIVRADRVWAVLALYTMAGGIIGALLAALPGFVDLFTLPSSPARKLGLWHMGVNLAIVVLYLVDFLWRRQHEVLQMGPIIMSAAAMLLLLVSGWLGGEMVYVHGVAVKSAERKPER